MKKLIGYIHFKDPKTTQSNQAIKSSEVFLVRLSNGWRVLVAGWNQEAFPPATHDENEARTRARVFIQTRNGTCLKKPKMVGT